MKRATLLSVTLVLTVASTVLSQEPKKRGAERDQQQPMPFQQVFTLRGVDFAQAQQAQVEELRNKYTPQLIEIQKKFGEILTDEQRQAQREAFRAAREAGKQDAELRKAVEAALKPTTPRRTRRSRTKGSESITRSSAQHSRRRWTPWESSVRLPRASREMKVRS